MDLQTMPDGSFFGSRRFDAFGGHLSSTGSWYGPNGYGGSVGYQEVPQSGLKLLGHRYYDSSTGRFLTRDPIKDGGNWYSYCENNPVSGIDPDGLQYVKNFFEGFGTGLLLTPGNSDIRGQFKVGHEGWVKLPNRRTKVWGVPKRILHLDNDPNAVYRGRHIGPHWNSEVFKGINHEPVNRTFLNFGGAKLGSTAFIKGIGRAFIAVSLVVDAIRIFTSDDPAAEAVKALTVYGGAWLGATIGTAIMPGVGTLIGGVVGASVTGLIVYWDEYTDE